MNQTPIVPNASSTKAVLSAILTSKSLRAFSEALDLWFRLMFCHGQVSSRNIHAVAFECFKLLEALKTCKILDTLYVSSNDIDCLNYKLDEHLSLVKPVSRNNSELSKDLNDISHFIERMIQETYTCPHSEWVIK